MCIRDRDNVSKRIRKLNKRLTPGSEIWATSGSKKEMKNCFHATESVMTKLVIILKNEYRFLNKIVVFFLIFTFVFYFS